MESPAHHGASRWQLALAAACLLAFGLWSALLALDVRAGRAAVEERVGWLQAVHALSVALQELPDGAEARARVRRDAALAFAPAQQEMAQEAALASLAAEGADDLAALRQGRAVEGEVLAFAGRLVPAIRASTGRLSAELGEMWDELTLVVLGAIVLAALVMGLLLLQTRTAARLAAARDELARQLLIQREEDATLRMLAAGMAHEINNPLLYLSINLQNLSRELSRLEGVDAGRAARLLRMTERALRGADHITRLARDLRTLGEPGELAVRDLDLADAVEEVIGLSSPTIESHARLAFATEARPRVEASPSRVRQVVLNLLINAAQALEGAGVANPAITVRVRTADGLALVEVEDNGPGMDEETLSRAFEPFFSTKGAGGSGLGLHIARSLAREHGGELRLSSVPREGTRATLVLPARGDEAREEVPAELAPPVESAVGA